MGILWPGEVHGGTALAPADEGEARREYKVNFRRFDVPDPVTNVALGLGRWHDPVTEARVILHADHARARDLPFLLVPDFRPIGVALGGLAGAREWVEGEGHHGPVPWHGVTLPPT